ncbi:PCYCGC motif-containing (lipo)protein [Priestia megaterium]|uniref:PCYCGC motif-containing (lipo)protein n=1 Tax=Priestia megaterium TaxID=1404 RepID=UPI0034593EF8
MLIVSIVSTACSSSNTSEETASNEVLPEFLKDKPEEMQTIYMNAVQNKGLLENISCYCCCGESAGHKNNYDCFIHENKKDGKVVWDDHGTKCGVGLEIAAQSVSDLKSGISIKQIRQLIVEKYKSGYATPNPEV